MSPAYVARLRRLENFFVRGGRVEDAAGELGVSTKTVRRMMECLRAEGGEVVQQSKGFWKCTQRVFREKG